jgi:hypothetical protein
MKLANIRILAEDTELDPKFAECVNKVALARPEFVFTFDANKHKAFTSHATIERGSPHPDKHMYARRLEVTQDGTHVGFMTIDRNYHRRSGVDVHWRISIASRMVRADSRHRVRGSFEETHTTNIDTAVRNAKKFLVRPPLGALMYERGTMIVEQYENALNKLEADIVRGRLMGDQAQMQLLLNAYLRGQEPDAQMASVYRATVMNPKYEAALSEYMLAQHMRHHPDGVMPICLMPEGLYAFFTGGELLGPKEKADKADVQLVPFEALPELWQDRLAVLQLLSDRELVKDVGYRLNDLNFLIVK